MSQYYKFKNGEFVEPKSGSSYFRVLLILFLSGFCFYLDHNLNEAEDKIKRLESQSKFYFNTAVENQLKYEETLDANRKLEKNVADLQGRLAAAAEASRAAKVRASRTRRAVSTVSRSTSFAGGLRDITMYCPTGNRTASGKTPQRGMVATISRAIPFGTHVLIEGLGEFVVEDRIGHGSEFDIFTPSCAKANRFGRQHRRVTILN